MNTSKEQTQQSNTHPIGPLDLERLRRDLRRLEHALRAQKGVIAEAARGGRDELPRLQRELGRLKVEATLLCAIRAHARGRLHMRRCLRAHVRLGLPQVPRFTPALQARLIGDRWRAYALDRPRGDHQAALGQQGVR